MEVEIGKNLADTLQVAAIFGAFAIVMGYILARFK